MAIPPCYADLAKNVSDLFSKGYNFGDVKLDVSSSGAGNTSFKASATNHAQSDGSRRVSGNLEVKREVLRHGNLDVSLSSKFNSDRTVNTTLTANNVGADNLKVQSCATVLSLRLSFFLLVLFYCLVMRLSAVHFHDCTLFHLWYGCLRSL